MTFSAHRLTPLIGSEIKSDASTLLDGKHASDIRDLLDQRGVLVMRNLHFTEDQQKAFSTTIGELMPQNGKTVLNISLDKKLNGLSRRISYWVILLAC